MAQGDWENHDDNFPWMPHFEDRIADEDRDYDLLVPPGERHIIARRNGLRVWLPHKCINCGADIKFAVSWIRRYYWPGGINLHRPDEEGFDWGNYTEEDYQYESHRYWIDANNRYDMRFHEACTKCKRRQSWPYVMPKPAGWKAPEMPEHKREKDAQRQVVYRWQKVVTKYKPLMIRQLFDLPVDHAEVAKLAVEINDHDWACTVFTVNQLFDLYGIKRCQVLKGKPTQAKSWMRGRSIMKLAEGWGQARWVAVHEFAHALVYTMWEQGYVKKRVQAHGPEFMAVYLLLLEELGFCSFDELAASAAEYKLLVGDKGEHRALMTTVKVKGSKGVAKDDDEPLTEVGG